MYAIQGLWTAVQLDLPVSFVIVNNGRYEALEGFGRLFGLQQPVGTRLGNIDFCELAHAQGLESRRATEPEELDGYFPELRDLVQHCQFNDCTHTHEPGCAVRRALEEGTIHPERYESYLRLRSGQD